MSSLLRARRKALALALSVPRALSQVKFAPRDEFVYPAMFYCHEWTASMQGIGCGDSGCSPPGSDNRVVADSAGEFSGTRMQWRDSGDGVYAWLDVEGTHTAQPEGYCGGLKGAGGTCSGAFDAVVGGQCIIDDGVGCVAAGTCATEACNHDASYDPEAVAKGQAIVNYFRTTYGW